jgi:hypothetical protein
VRFRADVFRRAAGLRAAVFFLAVVFFRVDLRAAGLRAPVFFAGRLRAVAFFLAAGLRAVVFFRAADLRAVVFFLAGLRAPVFFLAADLRAVVFLRAAGLRAAVLRAAGLRAAALRRVDVVFRAVDLLRAVVFLAAAMLPPSFPLSDLVSGRHALQAPSFPFTHAAPDSIPLVAAKGVVEALDPNGTLAADPLGLPR